VAFRQNTPQAAYPDGRQADNTAHPKRKKQHLQVA
jgi:hypothetical protein